MCLKIANEMQMPETTQARLISCREIQKRQKSREILKRLNQLSTTFPVICQITISTGCLYHLYVDMIYIQYVRMYTIFRQYLVHREEWKHEVRNVPQSVREYNNLRTEEACHKHSHNSDSSVLKLLHNTSAHNDCGLQKGTIIEPYTKESFPNLFFCSIAIFHHDT